MRCPGLNELPPPPAGRSGWPWTAETPPPGAADASADWPRITIVTPSFNQAEYIEETIRSVLLQGYPDLEYYVIDGGSTDGSADIIRKYAQYLAGWASEPDRGQSHALNKGFARASGQV
ncbi:MAG: glycosyltransferase, partial [Lysobacterales bacterium]